MKEITAIYIRLSMEDDDLDDDKTESFSVQNQRLFITQFLQASPEIQQGELREFVDDGYSGINFERPAFQEMLGLIRKGQVRCIVVKDFSRFGRNYIEVGNYLEQLFPMLKVRFELSRKVLQTKRGLAKQGLFLGGIIDLQKEEETHVNTEKESCIDELEHIVKLDDTSWMTKEILHNLIKKINISKFKGKDNVEGQRLA